MRTLYTQLFSDFLTDNASTPEWTAIVTKFSSFPAFYIDGVRKSDGTYTSVNLSSLYDLFVDRYNIYEIGGETPDLFVHAVNDKLTELQIKYLPKIAILNQLVYAVDGTTHVWTSNTVCYGSDAFHYIKVTTDGVLHRFRHDIGASTDVEATTTITYRKIGEV